MARPVCSVSLMAARSAKACISSSPVSTCCTAAHMLLRSRHLPPKAHSDGAENVHTIQAVATCAMAATRPLASHLRLSRNAVMPSMSASLHTSMLCCCSCACGMLRSLCCSRGLLSAGCGAVGTTRHRRNLHWHLKLLGCATHGRLIDVCTAGAMLAQSGSISSFGRFDACRTVTSGCDALSAA